MRTWTWLTVAAGSFCLCAGSALAQQAGGDHNNSGVRSGQPRTSAPRTSAPRTSAPRTSTPRAASRGIPSEFDGASGQNQRYTARRATADYGEYAHTDQQLAAWLLVDNRGEIALAKLAQEKTSNSDVREFAQHLINDHSKMVEKLEQFAGGRRRTRGSGNRASDNRAGDNQVAANRRSQGGQADEYAAGGQARSSAGLNFVRLKQQLGQQCLASAKQELEQKDDKEFDECYIGMQIAKHMEMIDTLKVFSHYASENLDQVIEEGEDTSQEHLDRAKELIKELTSGDSKKRGSDNRDSSKRSSGKRDTDTQ